MQESDVPAHGRAAHSAWRNYDDFNEFFWCLLAYFRPYGLLWGSSSLHKEIEFLFLYSVSASVLWIAHVTTEVERILSSLHGSH
jgi:hypothetical protein